MSLASIASLLLALAKAVPAANQLWDKLAAGWISYQAEKQRTEAHATIDEDRRRIIAEPWRCPARCPYQRMFHPAEGAESDTRTTGAP